MHRQMITFLPCTDIEKTTRFFETAGLAVTRQQAEGTLRIFNDCWGFCAYSDGRPPLSGDRGVCLSVVMESRSEVDAKYEELRKAGYSFLHEPMVNAVFPVYSFIVYDPDQYKVEFQVFLR